VNGESRASRPPKRNADTDAQKPDRAAVRAAHLTKFTWTRDASADKHLSQAAKHLASRMAIDKFGTNGTAKATQKELAKICGTTTRTIRRATTELGDGHYLDVEQLGGANRYKLIPPDERIELWKEAEQDWHRICHQWDAAKRQWEWNVQNWLTAEAQYLWIEAEERAKTEFTTPIFRAMSARAHETGITDPWGLSIYAAEGWWANRASGVSPQTIVKQIADTSDGEVVALAIRKGYHTPAPRCTDCGTELPADRAELTVCIDCAWDVTGPGTDTPQADNMSPRADKIGTLGGQDRYPRRTRPTR
jgi:hypothetical protein